MCTLCRETPEGLLLYQRWQAGGPKEPYLRYHQALIEAKIREAVSPVLAHITTREGEEQWFIVR